MLLLTHVFSQDRGRFEDLLAVEALEACEFDLQRVEEFVDFDKVCGIGGISDVLELLQ